MSLTMEKKTFSDVHKLLNIMKENSDINKEMKSKIEKFQVEMLESLTEEKKTSDVDKSSDLGDSLESLSDSSSEKNR